MGIGGRIDDDPIAVVQGLLDPVHNLSFMVGLKGLDIDSKTLTMGLELSVDLIQTLMTIDVWFPFPEHVQVGTVDDYNFFTRRIICHVLLQMMKSATGGSSNSKIKYIGHKSTLSTI
jgi:hypothetical protein